MAQQRSSATLFDVPAGRSAVIATTNADRGLNRRLRELGLRPGARVSVLQKTAGGGRMVKVRNTTYALDAHALKHILTAETCEAAS